MKKPQTVKSLLSACVTIANTPTIGIIGSKKLTKDEESSVAELTVILQNKLGEMDDILDKFNLKYP